MTTGQRTQNTAPLLGFVVAETDDEIRVRVAGGTWIVDRSDIEYLSEWESPVEANIHGRPVEVVVKDGAELGFLQIMTVSASDRPLTLPPVFATLVGAERIQALGETWGAQHSYEALPEAVGASPTVCDCSDPNGFGLVIKTDDCKD